jgi:hypothetical protein
MSKKKQLEDLIRKKAREGRINCSLLRKIRKCDFGCF